MIFVNFKTYKEGSGLKAVELAEICSKVAQTSKIPIIPVVQTVDLWHIKQHFPELPVWVQHMDWFPQGQFTGWINLEAVIEAGGQGVLLNHAEHRLPPGTIKQVIRRVKEQESLRAGEFKVMVCCRTLGQAERLAKFKPDFLAYEPPELIGGDLAVSQAKPEVIQRIVKKIPGIPIIVGAGVKSGKDVKRSLELGAVGVLVSSGVVLAKDQKKALEDLAKGLGK